MCIDLDAGHIDAYNFKLTSKNIYLNSNPNDANIPGSTEVRDNYKDYLMRFGDEKKTGYIGLKSNGELEIRVNSLHITGSLGNKNLLQQTAPALASTVKYWNQYTKTTEAVLNPDGTIQKEATTTTTWKKESHDSNGTFHYQWKLTKWTNPDASASGVISWDYNSTTEKSQAYDYDKGDKVKAYGNLWTADKNIAQHALPPGDEDSDWSPAIEVVTSGDKEKVIHVNGNDKQIYQTMSLRDKKKYTLSGYARSKVANKKFGLIVGSSNQYEIIYSNLDEDNLYHDPMPREWTFEDTEWHYFRCTFLTPGDTSSTSNTRRLGFTCEAPFEIWHTKLEEGEIASAWSPAPEDVEDNATVTTNKYDQNLAQDAVFEKLFKDPKTGLMADGISLVPADESVTGIPELYINASYIAAGILRSKNWDGKIKAKYNTNAKEYDYTVHTNPKYGMYIDLNQGKVWAAKFELNAWDYENSAWDTNKTIQTKGKGLYLNSDPAAKNNNGSLNTHSYYLKLGDLTKNFITFDIDGNLNITIKDGIINAQKFILDAWANDKGLYLNSHPENGTSYFRVGEKDKTELRYWLDSDGNAKFKILAKQFTLSTNSIYLSDTASSFTINGTSRSVVLRMGSQFGVAADGTLYASNAIIKGDIYADYIEASDGKVGGWSIGTNTLTGGGVTLNSSTGTISGGTVSGSKIVCGSNFEVSSTGTITAKDGTVGGWKLGASTLTGGAITLNSSGTITSAGAFTLSSSGVSISKGDITLGSNFKVTSTGVLTAKGATLEDLTVKNSLNVTGTGTLTTAGKAEIGGALDITGTLSVGGTPSFANGGECTVTVDTPWSLKKATMKFKNGILISFTEGNIDKNNSTINQDDADKRYVLKKDLESLVKDIVADISIDWDDISGKPTSFTPKGHDHYGTSHSHSVTVNGTTYSTTSNGMELYGAIT